MNCLNRKGIPGIVTLFSGLIWWMSGCTHAPGIYYNNTSSNSGACSADTVYFQNDILPLLNSTCAVSSCHDATTGREGLVLSNYGAVMRTGGIDLQNPSSSRIYRAIIRSGEGHMPPGNYPAWSSAEAANLLTWISQGAKNNACTQMNCDTTTVTFAGSVQPILQKYCLGCHSGGSPSGGIDLSNLTSLMVQVNNGALMASIRQDAGYNPMPLGGPKLSNCEIATIGIWVRDTTLTYTGDGGSAGSGGSTCSPDTVYFQNTVLPIIVSNCATSGCHDATTRREGVQLTDYASIINTGRIVAGNPGSSRLYGAITTTSEEGKMPPGSRTALTSTQISEIQKWILQGALNNSCDAACDTTNVTFTNSVMPIIQNFCLGCHNAPSPGGNVYLRNYSDIITVVNNGQLWGAVNQDPGFIAMPLGGNKLSSCDLSTIKIWINNGAPNN